MVDVDEFYHSRGRYEAARDTFARIVELLPDNPLGFSNLATAYGALGDYDSAVKAVSRSIDLNPSAAAYRMLASVRYHQGDYRQSAALNEKAQAPAGGVSYTIWGNLANAYRWTPELAA